MSHQILTPPSQTHTHLRGSISKIRLAVCLLKTMLSDLKQNPDPRVAERIEQYLNILVEETNQIT